MNPTQLRPIALSMASLFVFVIFLASRSAAAPTSGTVLFLGDSITAGYGLDISQSFPALIQKKIDLNGWNFKVVNAGQSGDTSAGGLGRIDWLLKNRVDILVLELGANDGLRGLSVDNLQRNLQAIIDRTKGKYPAAKIIIAGMKVPPNMGSDYTRRFDAVFAHIAQKNHAAFIPFILDRVGGVRELNLTDGIHPTAKGHEIVAETVWKVLQPILRSLNAQSNAKAALKTSMTDEGFHVCVAFSRCFS